MNDGRTVWEDVDGRQKYTFLAESSFRHVLKRTESKQLFLPNHPQSITSFWIGRF